MYRIFNAGGKSERRKRDYKSLTALLHPSMKRPCPKLITNLQKKNSMNFDSIKTPFLSINNFPNSLMESKKRKSEEISTEDERPYSEFGDDERSYSETESLNNFQLTFAQDGLDPFKESVEILKKTRLYEQIKIHFQMEKEQCTTLTQEEFERHKRILTEVLDNSEISIEKKTLEKLEKLSSFATETNEALARQLSKIFDGTIEKVKKLINYEELKLDWNIIDYLFASLVPPLAEQNDTLLKQLSNKNFLISVLKNGIKKDFHGIYPFQKRFLTIDELASASLKALASEKSLVQNHIKAMEQCDILRLQRNWMQIVNLIHNLMSIEIKFPNYPIWAPISNRNMLANLKVQWLEKAPKMVLRKDFKEIVKKTQKFCKIYPSNQTDHLIYPSSEKEKIISQPLTPLFDMLITIGRKVKKVVDKTSQDKSTNIISAILTLVVSTKPHSKGGRHGRMFVDIPLDFDYRNVILSKDSEDSVVKNRDAFFRSIADEQQLGGQILERPCESALLEEKQKQSKIRFV